MVPPRKYPHPADLFMIAIFILAGAYLVAIISGVWP